MTFRMALASRPVACTEVFTYVVLEVHCVFSCGIHVATDYLLNIVARDDMSNDSIYSIF